VTHPSIYAAGPPLPPNRRVPGKRARSGIVEAPDESVSLDPMAGPSAEHWGEPLEKTGRVRFREALHLAAGVLVTVASALACVWGMVRYTRTSPRFAVRVVEVQGSAHRTPEDIALLGGIARGQNIFTADLEAAKLAILADPWMEQVSIRRKLPSAIVIEVLEREAAALVAVGADLYLSTRQGELFKKPERGDPYDLPVVSGTRAEDIVKDRAMAVATTRKALDLVSDYEHLGAAKQLPVQEVHLEDDGGVVLTVGKDAIQLHLGKGPYRRGLEQASRVLAEVAARRAQASVVFLDNEAHPERVVVRMR
jgi:cell division protein FtsQ